MLVRGVLRRGLVVSFLFVVVIICGCVEPGNDASDDDGDGTEISIPASIESNCIGFLTGANSEISTIHLIGGAWTRAHAGPFAWGWIETSDGAYDYAETDDLVETAQGQDVAILGTIWPFADWDQSSCHGNECRVSAADDFYPEDDGLGIPASRCAPCNYDDYNEFLTNLVERYDGDGTDDMNGLTLPIKYWEVLNEPSMDSDTLRFFIGTKAEYVEILRQSHDTIKAACSDCTVVQGGAAGASPDVLAYWEDILDLGGADYFDVANVHYINSGDLNTLNVEDFKELFDVRGIDKPVWVTEAQFEDEDEVIGAVDGALVAGAAKIFFTTFEIGKSGPPTGNNFSDVYTGIADRCP